MPSFLNDNWIYDSTLVNGYVEKYSNHNMRRRNTRLLKHLKNTATAEEIRLVKDKLIENNLPLAMHIALRYWKSHQSGTKSVDDLFQDGCIGLIETINEHFDPTMYNQYEFQKYLYIQIRSAICTRNNAVSIEDVLNTECFSEENHPKEKEPRPNREFIVQVVKTSTCTNREKEILLLWFYGDKEKYIEPEDAEDIGFWFGLTRERVRQIKEKALKKLRNYVEWARNNGNISIIDFYE